MPKDELEKLIADVKRKLKRQGRGSAVKLANHLGVSRSDLNYWLNQGREPGYRIGAQLRTWADLRDEKAATKENASGQVTASTKS